MASAEELIERARLSTTAAELDAIDAEADNRVTVTEAVAKRREELTNPAPTSAPTATATAPNGGKTTEQVIERTLVRRINEPPAGPNATTEAPAGQYFLDAAGQEINAFGEPKDSREDRARRAGGGIA